MFRFSIDENHYVLRRGDARARKRRTSTAERTRAAPFHEYGYYKQRSHSTDGRMPRPEILGAESTDEALKHEAAERLGIPTGYLLKHWDPSEKPIIIGGTVFDSNSLGKWIYDWCKYAHGARSSYSETAGELWLLMVRVLGKVNVLEQRSKWRKRFRHVSSENLESLIHEGCTLRVNLLGIFSRCEKTMYTKLEYTRDGYLGRECATAFIEKLLSPKGYLRYTTTCIEEMRSWDQRFDGMTG